MRVRPKDSIRPSFLGRGLSFPVKLDGVTGGFRVSEGSLDQTSVGLEYMADRYTMRESVSAEDNHIADSIRHILLTRIGEHDTLPEFGSKLTNLLFENISVYTMQEFEVWATLAIARWEKRVKVNAPNDITWMPTEFATDQGRLPVSINPVFLGQQTGENLVSPFVTPEQARSKEYSLAEKDANKHDQASRYRDFTKYKIDGIQCIRHRRVKKVKFASDDIFYKVKHYDTWLLISHELYNDIRFWWVVTDFYLQDAINDGKSRSVMDTTGNPTPGDLIRVPSRERLLMELVA